MVLRSPIVAVLGHVDHGKSSLLDSIRGTNVVSGEAGAITQAIGASIIPINTIIKKSGKLLEKLNIKLTIPGLLFIDTPGHAAFTSLRKRGGSLADIAILVVDINEGMKPQTKEAVEILKSSRTPFIIAANKLDLIPGFQKREGGVLKQISEQQDNVITTIETRLYELVGALYDEFKLSAERFDRVSDFTQQIAIIPCSAKTGLGVEELLMVLAGLAQKYLEKNLSLNVDGPGKGMILEVKEQKGLGKTIDVILYDGTLKVGDTIVYGTLEGAKSTKIRALFEPKPLSEMRDKKSKFNSVKEVTAATGVKIMAPDLEGAVAGMSIRVVQHGESVEEIISLISDEMTDVQIETDKEGVILKADTLGSLEAMIKLLKEKDIPIRKASVGQITKKDISDAESNYEKNPSLSVILGFNIKDVESTDKVKIIVDDVIYKMIERFEEWQEEITMREEAKKLTGLVRPCKIEILQNAIFRQSNPCIVGVEVLKGALRTGMPLMKEDGRSLTIVKSIQFEKENLTSAEKGRQVAVSLPNIIAGRHVEEMDFLYSDIPEDDFRQLKKYVKHLTSDEKEVLKQVAEIKRRHNPVWGV